MRAPRTTLKRLFWAWFAGTFERLHFARARRTALHDPMAALEIVMGRHRAQAFILATLEQHPDAREGLAFYRSIVHQHVAPGGHRLWPKDPTP